MLFRPLGSSKDLINQKLNFGHMPLEAVWPVNIAVAAAFTLTSVQMTKNVINLTAGGVAAPFNITLPYLNDFLTSILGNEDEADVGQTGLSIRYIFQNNTGFKATLVADALGTFQALNAIPTTIAVGGWTEFYIEMIETVRSLNYDCYVDATGFFAYINNPAIEAFGNKLLKLPEYNMGVVQGGSNVSNMLTAQRAIHPITKKPTIMLTTSGGMTAANSVSLLFVPQVAFGSLRSGTLPT